MKLEIPTVEIKPNKKSIYYPPFLKLWIGFSRFERMKKFLLILSLLFSCNHNTEECFCTEEYNPVCAGYNQYSNPCKAKCDGFENSEITILLTQEEINTGMLVEVNCSI